MLESNSDLASFRTFEGGPAKFQEMLYSKAFNYKPAYYFDNSKGR